jgi:hypothetical protein
MTRSAAQILREYGPFPGVERVHGLTFDGRHVWFASGDRLNALDPASGMVVHSLDVAAHAGTAFDGRHLFQIAEDRIQKIDPRTGRVLATIPAPGKGGDSGLAWAEGTLWVGQYRERTLDGGESELRRVEPRTGAVLKRLEMPPGVAVSGLEAGGGDRFFCGGGTSGKVRAVRRPGRSAAAGTGATTRPRRHKR